MIISAQHGNCDQFRICSITHKSYQHTIAFCFLKYGVSFMKKNRIFYPGFCTFIFYKHKRLLITSVKIYFP